MLLSAAIAAWVLADGGMPGFGVFELTRQMVEGDRGERYCIGVDLGQSADSTAICCMSRRSLPDPARDDYFEPALDAAQVAA